LDQVLGAEVVPGELALVVSAEGRLHGVDGGVLFQLIEKRHSSSGLLGFLVSKPGVIVNEERADVGENKGEKPCVFWRRRVVASIHENVLASTVPVEVTENCELPLLRKVVNHLLRVVDCGVQ